MAPRVRNDSIAASGDRTMRLGGVKTPTLVVVGENDDRTPPSEADQYYTALQLRGVPTALVRVPAASHGGIAARPSHRRDCCSARSSCSSFAISKPGWPGR